MSKKIYPSKKITPYASSGGASIVMPSVEHMLSDALRIMSNEIAKLTSKSNQGRTLDSNENRVLQGYVKSLVEINKEIREQSKKDDLSNLSNEEIIELLKSLLPEKEAIKLLKEHDYKEPKK